VAVRKRKGGPLDSDTLLKGEQCLWLGFHLNVSDYLTRPITHHFFQKRALNGHIGTINQAGVHGAEVEFPVDSEKGFARLNISVEELLPMTTQQAEELKESISVEKSLMTLSNTQGETTVSTQTAKTKRPAATTTIRKGTYTCEAKGCSFSSPSPQGLGTHRVKAHNLASRSQQRSGGRKVLITKTNAKASKPVSTTTKKIASTTPKKTVATGAVVNSTPNTREDWKAKHDAVVKRYNRLSTKHEYVIKTLKKLANDNT